MPDFKFDKNVPDERLLAMVCHAGLFFAPVIAASIVWLWEQTKDQPSQYIIAQSREAVIYQTIFMVIVVGLGGFLALFSYWLVGWTFIPAYTVILFAGSLYAAYAAYQAFQGTDFRYYLPLDKLGEFEL